MRELDVELDIVMDGPHGAIPATAILGQDSHNLQGAPVLADAGLWPQDNLQHYSHHLQPQA